MSKIAIIVELHVKPGMLDAAMAHFNEHASKTLAEEPGCERFDVLRPRTETGEPDGERVMLFELYRDQAAFDAHRANPRMPGNAEKSAPMLAGRKLTVCETA